MVSAGFEEFGAKVALHGLLLAITTSRTLIALRFEVDCIERLAAGDKEPVFHRSAEAEIGGGLGQVDLADEVAVGGETMDPVVAGARPPGARRCCSRL